MLPSRTNPCIVFLEEWIELWQAGEWLMKDEDKGRLWKRSEEEGRYVTQLEMNFPLESADGEPPMESIWRLSAPACTDSSPSIMWFHATCCPLLINPYQSVKRVLWPRQWGFKGQIHSHWCRIEDKEQNYFIRPLEIYIQNATICSP